MKFEWSNFSLFFFFLIKNDCSILQGGKDGEKIQYLRWRPGTSEIIYVFKNDIYWKKSHDQAPGSDVQLSKDGDPTKVYNGIPDWVYEEEVLSTNHAMYFTKDGSKMAYTHFDDNKVQLFQYTKFGDDPEKDQYPDYIQLRYPKSGTPNPTIQIRVIEDFNLGDHIPVNPPKKITDSKLSDLWYYRQVVWMFKILNFFF